MNAGHGGSGMEEAANRSREVDSPEAALSESVLNHPSLAEFSIWARKQRLEYLTTRRLERELNRLKAKYPRFVAIIDDEHGLSEGGLPIRELVVTDPTDTGPKTVLVINAMPHGSDELVATAASILQSEFRVAHPQYLKGLEIHVLFGDPDRLALAELAEAWRLRRSKRAWMARERRKLAIDRLWQDTRGVHMQVHDAEPQRVAARRKRRPVRRTFADPHFPRVRPAGPLMTSGWTVHPLDEMPPEGSYSGRRAFHRMARRVLDASPQKIVFHSGHAVVGGLTTVRADGPNVVALGRSLERLAETWEFPLAPIVNESPAMRPFNGTLATYPQWSRAAVVEG